MAPLKHDINGQYKILLDNIPDVIVVSDNKGTIQYINQDIGDYKAADVIGNNIDDFAFLPEKKRIKDLFTKALSEGTIKSTEIRSIGTNWYSIKIIPIKLKDKIPSAMIIAKDISEKKHAQDAFNKKLRFEHLISEISTDFINVHIDKIDKLIKKTLKSIVLYTGAVCGAVFFLQDSQFVQKEGLIWSCDKGNQIHNLVKELPANVLNYYKSLLNDQIPIIFGKPEDIPEKYRDILIAKKGFSPLIIVPMIAQKKLYGAIGIFGGCNEKKIWDKESINHLKIISDIIVNTIDKKKAEHEKELILSSVSELVVYQDINFKIIWVNKAVCEAFNLTKDQIHGQYCYNLWFGRSSPCEGCPVSVTIQTGNLGTGEMTTPDGRVWFIKSYPVKSIKGDVIGIVEVTREITQLKKIEIRLRLTQFSIDHAAVATYWIAWDGSFVYVNEEACKSLGYTKEELLKLNIFDINSDIPLNEWDLYWRDIREKGSVFLETHHRTKDGRTFPVESFGNYLKFEGKEYIFTFVRDVSEKKLVKDEKLNLEKQLLQVSKMEAVGRLAGGIAHDFNNILTGIRGYVHYIGRCLKEDDSLQNDISEIQKAIDRAAGLTERLLTFSRKQIIAPRIINLNQIVMSEEKILARTITENIELVLELEESLKNIFFDEHQMEQVIMNLAVNAMEAMAQGGKLIIKTQNIHLDSEYCLVNPRARPGEYVLLTVSDTGCGMDEGTKDLIFEPFFTTRNTGGGTGLGLATVYGIIDQHDSFIVVQSEKGKGSVFMVFIPSVTASDEDKKETDKKEKNEMLFEGHETILLVEDEEMVRKFTKKLLTLQGYVVIDAHNLEDAQNKCINYKGPIHLLLTDVVMPGINGKQLYDIRKQRLPKLKVLYMSGYSEHIISIHGILEMDTNFIYKPFTIELLTKKIRQILDKSK